MTEVVIGGNFYEVSGIAINIKVFVAAGIIGMLIALFSVHILMQFITAV